MALRHSNATAMSNVEIAKHCGVHDTTVMRVWKTIICNAEDGSVRKVTRTVNGRPQTYTMKVAKSRQKGRFTSITSIGSNTGPDTPRRPRSVPVLATTVENLERYLGTRGAEDVRTAFTMLLTPNPGKPPGHKPKNGRDKGRFTVITSNGSNNGEDSPNTIPINLRRRATKTGNISSFGRRSLARHRPDLLQKVEAGEESVHGAMVEAGLRDRMVQVPASDPERAGRILAVRPAIQ